jgi:hypothetical protein
MLDILNEHKVLKAEYSNGTPSVRECIQQHVSMCLMLNFDQIRQTDLITVQCCECGKDFKVRFEDVARTMFCENCKDIEVSKEHIQKLDERLTTIKHKLLYV